MIEAMIRGLAQLAILRPGVALLISGALLVLGLRIVKQVAERLPGRKDRRVSGGKRKTDILRTWAEVGALYLLLGLGAVLTILERL